MKLAHLAICDSTGTVLGHFGFLTINFLGELLRTTLEVDLINS